MLKCPPRKEATKTALRGGMAPTDDSKNVHEPLLNGDEPGETTVQVDDLVTQGEGGFQETRDGEHVSPDRCLVELMPSGSV